MKEKKITFQSLKINFLKIINLFNLMDNNSKLYEINKK